MQSLTNLVLPKHTWGVNNKLFLVLTCSEIEVIPGGAEPALEPIGLDLNVRVVCLLVVLDLDPVGVVDVRRHRGTGHGRPLAEAALIMGSSKNTWVFEN